MVKRMLSAFMIVVLTGCSGAYSYDASIQGPNGRYDIVGLRGALIDGTFPDGTYIKADDKPVPDQPSALSNMASVAGAALITREAD